MSELLTIFFLQSEQVHFAIWLCVWKLLDVCQSVYSHIGHGVARYLVWIYTFCSSLSVPIFRVTTVNWVIQIYENVYAENSWLWRATWIQISMRIRTSGVKVVKLKNPEIQVSKSWNAKFAYTLYRHSKSQNPEIRNNPENFHRWNILIRVFAAHKSFWAHICKLTIYSRLFKAGTSVVIVVQHAHDVYKTSH